MFRRVGKRILRRLFYLSQPLGLHVTRNHFYSPVPDTRTLKPSIWSRESKLLGIDLRITQAVELVTWLADRFGTECHFPHSISAVQARGDFFLLNPGYSSGDADFCYMLIRRLRPSRVIEIGSGFSTALIRKALLANQAEGSPSTFTSIDPYPSEVVKACLQTGELIASPVEEVPISFFTELGDGDVVFVDSSHTVRIGGDVTHIILEILPRLPSGAHVHFHDIFLPDPYPHEWVLKELRFWAEQYLLQAFLAFNPAFEVVWPGYYMHKHHPDLLRAHLPNYRPVPGVIDFPVSFWIRRVDR